MEELRYGFAGLRKSPVFTIAAILSLALGIGANSAVFSIVKAIFMSPLDFEDPDSLVAVYTSDEKNPGYLETSYLNYADYRVRNTVFSGLAAYRWVPISLSLTDRPEQVFGQLVTGNYFDLLGVEPALGRFFRPEEDEIPGAKPVVVLSAELWRSHFKGDREAIGRRIHLNGHSFLIIGVAPEGFRGTEVGVTPAMWVPMMMYEQVLPMADEVFQERRALVFSVFGRLRPGTGLPQAAAGMKTIAAQLEAGHPEANGGRGVVLVPLVEATINPNVRQGGVAAASLLMAVVAVVLLIACANVASLLLARAYARRKEIAVRLALGASRLAIIRLVLVESLMIGLLAGAFSLVLTVWTSGLVYTLLPPLPVSLTLDFSLDYRVLAFTFALAIATGTLFGLMPALQSSRPDQVTALKTQETPPASSRRRFALREWLVIGQVSLSIVSLLVAGLLVSSLQNARKVDPGFDADRLFVMSFNLTSQDLADTEARIFAERIAAAVERRPDVERVSLAAYPPLSGGFNRTVFLAGETSTSSRDGRLVPTGIVDPDYLSTMGIGLVKGRDFQEMDHADGVKVAIVNETMAEQFWPGADPIGERFTFFGFDSDLEIVGVARDSKYTSLGESPGPYVYLPFSQNFSETLTLHVRAPGDPAALLESVRREVQELAPTMPLMNVMPVSALVDRSLWGTRIGAAVVGAFGLLALVLAAVGLFGSVAFLVSHRKRAIGIRMALGARGRDVVSLMIKRGVQLVALGLAVGLPLGFGLNLAMASLLYGIGTVDAMAYGSSLGILILTALVAMYLPARRAAAVDPVSTMKVE